MSVVHTDNRKKNGAILSFDAKLAIPTFYRCHHNTKSITQERDNDTTRSVKRSQHRKWDSVPKEHEALIATIKWDADYAVRCLSTEPANPHIPITTHTPSRTLDTAPPNEPASPPTKRTTKQTNTPSGTMPALLGMIRPKLVTNLGTLEDHAPVRALALALLCPHAAPSTTPTPRCCSTPHNPSSRAEQVEKEAPCPNAAHPPTPTPCQTPLTSPRPKHSIRKRKLGMPNKKKERDKKGRERANMRKRKLGMPNKKKERDKKGRERAKWPHAADPTRHPARTLPLPPRQHRAKCPSHPRVPCIA
ncbi:hypothetical protein PanWU01x14_329510, partial [Parasponia andersonii]